MQEPDIVSKDPQAYYAWLRSQRVPGAQAYQMVTDRFGSPKTRGELEEENAKAQEQAGYAQVGGALVGAVGGKYLLDQLNKPSAPTNVVSPTGKFAESGTIGVNRAVPPPTTTVDGSGSVVELSGKTATIDTPIGPQQAPVEALNDPGFMESINWGQVAQGGLAIAQLYGAYKSYQSGDKVGAGLSGVSGAANLATAAGADLGANLVPGLNIATGAYTGYKTAEAMSNMAAGSQRTKAGALGGASSGAAIGAGVGSLVPGIGTAIGAGVGAAIGATAGAIGSWTGSSKGKAQFMRDNIRGVLKEGGILDDKFQGTLADGSKYDFGKDGSTLKWSAIDKIAEKQPTAWNAAVPAADALAASYGFVGQKASDLAAWYAKGAVSNAGDDPAVARANMQHFAKQQGITLDGVKSKLDEALKDERINQNKYDYYMKGAQELLSNVPASAQPGETTTPIARPKKGEVGRQGVGLYRDDKGKLVQASSMREALEKAYKKEK